MFKRINSQIEELKNDKNINAGDKAGIFKVAEYLVIREDMAEKYNNPEKTLIEMWSFIKEEARKKAENGVAVLEDEEVYSLAIHYFDESNKALGIEKEQKKEKSTSKATKTSGNHTTVDKTQEQPKEENVVNIEMNENHEITKESYEQLEKIFNKPEEHKDDEIAMIFKGKPVTYKELREGNLFSRWVIYYGLYE